MKILQKMLTYIHVRRLHHIIARCITQKFWILFFQIVHVIPIVPMCVCGENPSPQNEHNLEQCKKETSIDLMHC